MKQVYHSNATTNIRLRKEINKSKEANNVLALKFGVSEKTVKKWKGRENFKDKSSKPGSTPSPKGRSDFQRLHPLGLG